MEETLTLDRIAYRSIYDYAAHYMGHLKDKAPESFDILVRCVKQEVPRINEMIYTFDESIWRPDEPHWHNNLIKFHVRLKGRIDQYSFYMAVDRGVDQELVSAPLPTTKWYAR
jgi:hypothetical protein